VNVELRVSANAEAARRGAAELLAEVASRGGHIALSGGSTPGPACEVAAKLQPDWSRAELWFADERCVDPDDERSNYRLVKDRLLDRLERPPAVEHRVLGELPPEQAAERYDSELRGVSLDFVMLGERERRAVAVHRPDVDRVTMTLPVLRGAATVAFLVLGREKAPAVARALGDITDPATPASFVRSEAGVTYAFLDRAAASGLVA
jgi:6-phosphogluconolactonase